MSQEYFPSEPRSIEKFDRYEALRNAWDYSIRFGRNLQDRLEGALSDNVETIALAGSFGRLEGTTESDADYILLVNDDEDDTVDADKSIIHDAIEDFGIVPPNRSGVFAAPRTVSDLIEKIGDYHSEEADMLGKRLLLLLESRPVYNRERYEEIVGRIFDKYAGFIKEDTTKEYVFLMNDLIRYFRYIAVNYQSQFWRQKEKWPLRNLKLRHSRLLMYAGLLFLIGEASKHREGRKISTVTEQLGYTPLERVAYVYDANEDYGFHKIAGLYNVFLDKLADSEVRAQLNPDDAEESVPYPDRYALPVFSDLKANSDAFISELTRFVLARRGDWSDRFFEYLIF